MSSAILLLKDGNDIIGIYNFIIMAIKTNGKSGQVPVKHLTSQHPPAFIMQALIFAAVVSVISFGIFSFLYNSSTPKVAQTEQQSESSLPVTEQINSGKPVDESLFQASAGSSVDPKKLENLFPEFKTQ